MATTQEIINKIGSHLLFLGVETINWNTQNFIQCADFCRQHDINSAILKVCDGGNVWYNNMQGYRDIVNIFHSHGVGVVPYGYFYGNTYNFLDGEIDLMQAYMKESGVMCADLEAEWNNKPEWSTRLNERMKPQQGIFLVSTWGDIDQQAWRQTALNMAPCVDAFMPQQYSTWLATQYGQFNGIGSIQPTVDLSNEAGQNDPVGIARTTYARGSRILSIWEYQFATANPSLFDAVLSAFPKTSVASPKPTQAPTPTPVTTKPTTPHPIATTTQPKETTMTPNQYQLEDAAQEWSIIYVQRQQTAPRTGTGIYNAWLQMLLQGKRLGPVVTQEMNAKDWNGNTIVIQVFMCGRAEYSNGVTRFFDSRGEIK